MTGQVDLAISAYGKPAQTAVALASLFEHSRHLIDKVFFQEELDQPYGDSVSPVLKCFPEINFVHHRPARFLSWHMTDRSQLNDNAFRQSIRYQYAWEHSSNPYLFITHNDCVFTEDIVGGMLSRISDGPYTGVGLIGQCWNCPAFVENLCSGDRQETFRPDYEFVKQLLARHPNARTKIEMVDPVNPTPLPECRLNEFACLIHLDACRSEVIPIGDIVPFGFMALDIGTEWFRNLVLRGHRFSHWPTGFRHAPFSKDNNGHGADFSMTEYRSAETLAFEHLAQRYPVVAERLALARNAAAR